MTQPQLPLQDGGHAERRPALHRAANRITVQPSGVDTRDDVVGATAYVALIDNRSSRGEQSGGLLLTVSQAARELGIGRRQTWELVWRGELPVVRLGPRTIRVARAVLANYVIEHSRPYHF